MKFAILIIGGILLFQTLPVSAGTFFETFDNFNLQDWDEVTERNFPVGEWRAVNDVLQAESKDDAIRMLVIKDAAWHDYEVEIDVMPLAKHGRGHIVLAARVNQTYAVIFAIGNIFWNAPAPIVSGVVLNLPKGQIVGLPLFFARIDKFFNMDLDKLNEAFNGPRERGNPRRDFERRGKYELHNGFTTRFSQNKGVESSKTARGARTVYTLR